MIRLYKNSKIYVLCPAGVATGGPELMHQFACTLRASGVDAQMYYLPSKTQNPVHNAYKQYAVPYVTGIEDDSMNVLVSTEVYGHIKECQKYCNIRKCLWWLSVDNFFMSKPIGNYFTRKLTYYRWGLDTLIFKFTRKSCFDLPEYIMAKYENFKVEDDGLLKQFSYHFYQSEYARLTLLRIGVNSNIIYPMSDYLNDQFIQDNKNSDTSVKEDIVVYYPKKGKKFTSKLIRSSNGSIKFVPIYGLSRTQMVELLNRAKVYIDFGHHPGKDRIPREAAICKCCIITGKRGAAKNPIDISIPDEYKFSETSTSAILDKIKECLREYSKHINDFEPYRQSILNEKNIFISQVNDVFEIE